MALSEYDTVWLIWGGVFFVLFLTWSVSRNKRTLSQMQQKLTNLAIEVKKANNNLIKIMNNSNIDTSEAEDIDETKLYVGNIDYSSSEAELAAHFSKYGQIEMVNIPLDRYTGRARGFGFVTFKKPSDAMKAMALDGSEFKGRQIQVNFARERVSNS